MPTSAAYIAREPARSRCWSDRHTAGGDDLPASMVRHHGNTFYARRHFVSVWGPGAVQYLTEAFFAFRRLSNCARSGAGQCPTRGESTSIRGGCRSAVRHDTNLWDAYWGQPKKSRNLHFEVCYYAPH